ncbi:MAG: hypothetical protein OXU20_35945 [Myxococcales bacterium]|nr:hypothetical protein [Myxococcales bacterium]
MKCVLQLAMTVGIAAAGLTLDVGKAEAQTYRFCNLWDFTWQDDWAAQDYLTHVPSTVGSQTAHYSWYNIVKDGTLIDYGWLDSEGCVETTAGPGSYLLRLYPAVYDGAKSFFIYPNDQEQWQTFEVTRQMNATQGHITQYNRFGSSNGLANMAAVAAHGVTRPELGFQSGEHYVAYTYQNCPGGAAACYHPGTEAMYLGEHIRADNFATQRRIWQKSIVGHELGHMISSRLAGGPSGGNYTSENCIGENDDGCTLPQECQCYPHVKSSNGAHCLQSREFLSDAAQEGFGHFYATALYNAPNQPGAFAYYKEFWTYGGTIFPPFPYEVGLTPVGWLEAFCLENDGGSDRGTEVDWQWFFYNLNRVFNSSNYSMEDFAAVYANSPGAGWSSWSELADSAAATFPGIKGASWQTAGDLYGVNH